MKRILIIEDDVWERELFKDILEHAGYGVLEAPDGKVGMRLYRQHPCDLVVTDIFMPEKDGHALILELLQEFPDANIFAITGKKSFEPQMELDIAETLGAKGFSPNRVN